jgi:hypothetical protein
VFCERRVEITAAASSPSTKRSECLLNNSEGLGDLEFLKSNVPSTAVINKPPVKINIALLGRSDWLYNKVVIVRGIINKTRINSQNATLPDELVLTFFSGFTL